MCFVRDDSRRKPPGPLWAHLNIEGQLGEKPSTRPTVCGQRVNEYLLFVCFFRRMDKISSSIFYFTENHVPPHFWSCRQRTYATYRSDKPIKIMCPS